MADNRRASEYAALRSIDASTHSSLIAYPRWQSGEVADDGAVTYSRADGTSFRSVSLLASSSRCTMSIPLSVMRKTSEIALCSN